MSFVVFHLITLLMACSLCKCNEQHTKQESLDNKTANVNKHNENHVKNKMHDAKHIQDKEHIKEHLKEQINVSEKKLSNTDLQFHYFKVHDNDNDDKLDGIELANAMAHYHDDEGSEKPEEYTEEELAGMVDQILEEDDLNKDGYIDYPEFISSQTKEENEAE
ncbi:multiple coagulation factor deficiency protein 2 homolog [Hydra vulgaris]|uniref:Multiple coagulation factor deficiency protein 2 homolog n=1 Tax=Hydra vulgaris TaxID=6087 RepID=A0ABM4CIG0_HYDVU